MASLGAIAALALGATGEARTPVGSDIAQRVDHLLAQMTLEEKMGLLRGESEPSDTSQGEAGFLPGVPRLGIPPLRFADGPPGVLTRVPSFGLPATMAVAATWSRRIADANGVVIGHQARALGVDVVLEPFINIDRDVTTARNYNTFGEDPFLSGQIAAASVRGIQSQGIMAEAKHYVGYDNDGYDTRVGEEALNEVYLEPFAAVVRAGVAAIMCSYNRINGDFACGNDEMLNRILKGRLGFKGFVTSDWGAVHSASYINDGLDVEMPGERRGPGAVIQGSFFSTLLKPAQEKPPLSAKKFAAMMANTIPKPLPEEPQQPNIDFTRFPRDNDGTNLGELLTRGVVKQATVTEAARRVLTEMVRFGYLDGKQKHTVTPEPVLAEAPIIEATAEASAVLLKNDKHTLPLRGNAIRSLALIGPTAGQLEAIGLFGERSTGLPGREASPLQALQTLAPMASIMYAPDDDMVGVPVPAAVLSHDGSPGLRRESGGSDAQIDFTTSAGDALGADTTETWSGDLTVDAAGVYYIYLQVLGARAQLFIDGNEVSRTGAIPMTGHGVVQHATMDNGMPTPDGLDNVRRAVPLTAGRHAIRIELTPDSSHQPAQLRLNWVTPAERAKAHERAIAVAKHANTAVIFLWSRGSPRFALPGEQNALVKEIAAVNPNTIVVLNTSQPIEMPWLSDVRAVLEMWWPGDEGGWATARLLLGEVNPSGHLPMTWAKRLADYPATDPRFPERTGRGVNGVTTYSAGVFVGYRWFDANRISPLFPFGYGLSYTNFAYSNLRVHGTREGGANVSFEVQNVGSAEGDAVPQVYLDAPVPAPSEGQFPPRVLVGFTRISLKPSETKTVTIAVSPHAFEYWSVSAHNWKHIQGARTIEVGLSSRDLPLRSTLSAVKVPTTH